MTEEQIKEEAGRRYIEGTASYMAFIFGAQWVLTETKKGEKQK